jgi:hypothetical protein
MERKNAGEKDGKDTSYPEPEIEFSDFFALSKLA